MMAGAASPRNRIEHCVTTAARAGGWHRAAEHRKTRRQRLEEDSVTADWRSGRHEAREELMKLLLFSKETFSFVYFLGLGFDPCSSGVRRVAVVEGA